MVFICCLTRLNSVASSTAVPCLGSSGAGGHCLAPDGGEHCDFPGWGCRYRAHCCGHPRSLEDRDGLTTTAVPQPGHGHFLGQRRLPGLKEPLRASPIPHPQCWGELQPSLGSPANGCSKSRSQPCRFLSDLGPISLLHLDLPRLCLVCLVSVVTFSATDEELALCW